jgi:hypothetical protein
MQCKSLTANQDLNVIKGTIQTEKLKIVSYNSSQYCQYFNNDKIKNYMLKSFLLHFLLTKSLIKSSKLIWGNKSASVMSRDEDSSLSCLIVVLFGYFLYASFERISVQFCSL